MPFIFEPQSIHDVIIIKPRIFPDDRGYFLETFKKSDFFQAGIKENFNQDNRSYSTKHVLRGLHYQVPPHAQGKIVSVISGAVWDVAVDVRKKSPTYKKWLGFELNSKEQHMLYIPPGFAHGFVTLTDNVCFSYKCTSEYNYDSEHGIRWNDPDLNIEWPVKNPLVSDKDNILPYLQNAVLFS